MAWKTHQSLLTARTIDLFHHSNFQTEIRSIFNAPDTCQLLRSLRGHNAGHKRLARFPQIAPPLS